jgi:hypothetical protein
MGPLREPIGEKEWFPRLRFVIPPNGETKKLFFTAC